MSYFGNAALTWSATSDANTVRVHVLQRPLSGLKPSESLTVFAAESLDKTVVETWTVGGGAYELVGEVRYDAHQQSLIDLLKAGAQNLTLTYYPNVADGDTKYACKLIAPRAPVDLALDAQRGPWGEQQVTLRLRLTNQAPFAPLWKATDALLAWSAGESLAQATFTRATSTAAPATYEAGPGYGTLSTAKTNQARVGWVSTASSVGPRTLPALRLEGARTNYVKDAENFGTANWTLAGGLTRSSGFPDARGTSKAWKLVDASTSASAFLSQNLVLGSSGQYTESATFAPATSAITELWIQTSSAAIRGRLRASWSSGVPTLTAVAGKIYGPAMRLRNGFYRVAITSASSAPFVAGAKPKVLIVPTSAGVGAKGSVYLAGVQVE